MNKEILINAAIGEKRIAILENGRLAELFVEMPDNERMVGDIYLGKVVNVVRGMRAAFIDIGLKQDAFLHFSDIGESFSTVSSMIDPGEEGHITQALAPEDIRVRQQILVQIIKEPISTKGARLTTQISIPGRFLVLVPNSKFIGVSKKIDSARERKRLRKIAREIRPEGFGLIVRTVADGRDKMVLEKDVENLKKTWKRIQAKIKKNKPPLLVYKDMGMTSSVIRDLFTRDMTRLIVDDRKLYRKIVTYLKDVAHEMAGLVEFYDRTTPIFDHYKIEDEIQNSLSRKVELKSGGSIIIDQTEALCAIDVNSGRFIGKKTQEQNTLKINLEAAKEIARQLRLRDLGGIIVIDFIDMREGKNKKRLHDELKSELKKDRAQANILPLSDFGLIEMTRERIRPSIMYAFSETCPTCGGLGRITSKSAVFSQIERWIKRFRAKSKERRLKIVTHPEMKTYLTQGIKSPIRRLMWRYFLKIEVAGDWNLEFDEFQIFSKKQNIDITDKFKS
ncbi:MAG: Rne/Rng family ribonuclease [Calditrichaeota bacterium]|nr:Rne/Rng family ribonuclease [Calditrichota bacterium]